MKRNLLPKILLNNLLMMIKTFFQVTLMTIGHPHHLKQRKLGHSEKGNHVHGHQSHHPKTPKQMILPLLPSNVPSVPSNFSLSPLYSPTCVPPIPQLNYPVLNPIATHHLHQSTNITIIRNFTEISQPVIYVHRSHPLHFSLAKISVTI